MHLFAHWALFGVIVTSAFGALVMCLLVFAYGLAPLREASSDDTARRALVTRVGQVAAAACFAITVMLAAVALSQQPAATTAATTADTKIALPEISAFRNEMAGLGQRVRVLEVRLDGSERQMHAVDTRVAATSNKVGNVVTRLEVAEKKLGDADARLRTGEARAAALDTRVGVVEAVERRRAASPESPKPVAANGAVRRATGHENGSASPTLVSAPAPSSVSAPAPSPQASMPIPEEATKPSGVIAPKEPSEQSVGEKMRSDWNQIKRGFSNLGKKLRGVASSTP